MPPLAVRQKKLLVLDTAFTFEMIRSRGLEDSVTCRDLGGFFEHVWTVHPFATLLTSDEWGPRFGRPRLHEVNRHHTFIEGTVGRFAALRGLFPLNFLLSQLGLFRMLVRLIRQENISAIRAGSPLYLGLLGWALSRATGRPLVVRVGANHDKIFATTGVPLEPRLMRSRKIEKAVERFVLPRADIVAGANQNNLDFALANGARPERSTLFRYGNLIDKRHFEHPGERRKDPGLLLDLGLEPGRFIMYVGRLTAVKHPDDVVHVLAQLVRRGHDLKALLVGDGPMRDDLLALSSDLGVRDRILLPGNQPQAWLAEVFPQAAAIVSPHTGRALGEAALAEVPVAAYDIDWQGELIEQGVTGELVPHLDKEGLANAVERFLNDRVYARTVAEALRVRALEMLDPVALDQHERDTYDRLLQS